MISSKKKKSQTSSSNENTTAVDSRKRTPSSHVPSWGSIVSSKRRHKSDRAVFSRPLADVMKDTSLSQRVPIIVSKCIEYLVPRYIEEEGIFRKSGSHENINSLKAAIDNGIPWDKLFKPNECHDVTGLLKMYIRELPSPVIDEKTHSELFDVIMDPMLKNEHEKKNTNMKKILNRLHKNEYDLLSCICLMLHQIDSCNVTNKMTASNLARVWAPTLAWKKECSKDPNEVIESTEQSTLVVERLISESSQLFADTLSRNVEQNSGSLYPSNPHTSDNNTSSTPLEPNTPTKLPELSQFLLNSEQTLPVNENEEKEIQEHTETEHPKRRKFQRTASLKVSKLLVHKREEYEERKLNRDLKRKRTEFNIPTKKSHHKEREIDNSLSSSSYKTEENPVTPTKALANSLRLLGIPIFPIHQSLSSPISVFPSDLLAVQNSEYPELPPIPRHSRLSDSKKRGGLNKRIALVYYTENYPLNQEMNKFLLDRDCNINNWRSEGQWPMRMEEAMKFVRGFKELVVIAEREESELYSGPITQLDDAKMKQLLYNPNTNKLRNPILFLKQESIVIVGWSRSIWSDIV